MVNCAASRDSAGELHVVLGACYPIPLRIEEAETAAGKTITAESAQAAGDAAAAKAFPLSKNAYKVEIARTLVRDTLLKLAEV